MIQLWVIVGLALAATAVSTLGATFSILGLGKLFSGAVFAVWLMAGSLELAKFVAAAYLHQTWNQQKIIFKSYLVTCVVVLSLITSMGIFGFLSDAYNASSANLDAENIKLQRLQNEQAQAAAEVVRITRSVDEIPDRRISRRLKARAEIEPAILALKQKESQLDAQIADAKLKVLEVKQKVGPLLYISKAFSMDIDTVVKYLILIFVSVFDPLAICLVIALSDATRKRALGISSEESLPRSEQEFSDLEQSETVPLSTLKMRYADDAAKPSEQNETMPTSKEDVG